SLTTDAGGSTVLTGEVVSEFGKLRGPTGITAGQDGNVWFTADGGIGRITPAGVVTEFRAGITAGSGLSGITAGPDGNLWFTESDETLVIGRIGRITTAGVVTEFDSGGVYPTGNPSEITAGPDGNLWFTGPITGKIGRMTPAGVVTVFNASGTGSITAGP